MRVGRSALMVGIEDIVAAAACCWLFLLLFPTSAHYDSPKGPRGPVIIRHDDLDAELRRGGPLDTYNAAAGVPLPGVIRRTWYRLIISTAAAKKYPLLYSLPPPRRLVRRTVRMEVRRFGAVVGFARFWPHQVFSAESAPSNSFTAVSFSIPSYTACLTSFSRGSTPPLPLPPPPPPLPPLPPAPRMLKEARVPAHSVCGSFAA